MRSVSNAFASDAAIAVRCGAVAAPVASGRAVRVVRIEANDLEPLVTTDITTAKKWGADPANAKNVLPVFRHILVKAPAGDADARAAARKKAEELLARLDGGEAFATLAKSSDDPGSAKNGGAYPGTMVKMFVSEMRAAYAALRPDERARKPIETQFGWHIVEKGGVDDAAYLDGHRAWLARSAAERIGKDLAKRLRHVDGGLAAAEVDKAFVAGLGADRAKIERLPLVVTMPAETCDGFAGIARGEGLSWRGDVLVVAALTNDERDRSEVDSPSCEESPGSMSAAELLALMERVQKENAPPDTTGWIATPPLKTGLFAVVRVEDAIDAASAIKADSLPAGGEVFFEQVGGRVVHFVRFSPGAKEKDADLLGRVRTFVATVKHPPKTSFAIERDAREDAAKGAYRTLLVRDGVVMDEKDIAKATARTDGEDQLVTIELRPEGAKRLEALTKEMLNGRIALLVDGIVLMTPRVNGVTTAGRLEIWIEPEATPAKRRANAERLAKALVRR